MEENRESQGIYLLAGSLDWWKPQEEVDWCEGKKHPHFILADWLAVAAIANEYPNEFIDRFPEKEQGEAAAAGLRKVYSAFTKFDLFSLGKNSLRHLTVEKREWEVPVKAREFILSRAE